jgi:hypothetical protein
MCWISAQLFAKCKYKWQEYDKNPNMQKPEKWKVSLNIYTCKRQTVYEKRTNETQQAHDSGDLAHMGPNAMLSGCRA